MPCAHAWTSRLTVGVLIGVLLSSSMASAAGRGDKGERKARQVIEAAMADPEAMVAITLLDGTTHVGRPQPLGEHSFLLIDAAGQATQVPYRRVGGSTGLTKKQLVIIAAATAAGIVMIVCQQTAGNVFCIPTE